MQIFKFGRVWLKDKTRHAHLHFEIKMAVAGLILELRKSLKIFFHNKIILFGVYLLSF